MKCLVLGGGGFIGSHLCEGLIHNGHHVRVFEKEGRSKVNLSHLEKEVDWFEGDFLNPEHLKDAVDNMEVIFHLISTTLPKSSNESPVYDISSNVISTLHLLDAAKAADVRKIVFFSSGGTVYGVPQIIPIPEDHPTNPTCSYGIHKLTIEKYLALNYYLHGLDYTIMRVSNPYGERQRPTGSQGAIAVFIYKALKGDKIEIWGDGSAVRDFIHVSDVVTAALKLTQNNVSEKIINIGSGVGLSLNEIIGEIEKVVGYKLNVYYCKSRGFDVPSNILDISRANGVLGWSPCVDFFEGIIKAVDYYKSNFIQISHQF